jgi:hypothetical protein
LTLQAAVPEESVVAFFVEIPLGLTIVKTTVAPDTPPVPWVTTAEMDSVFRIGAGGALTVIDSGTGVVVVVGGGVGMTVRFAVASIELLSVATTASTE